jgi:hypothetical protein
MPPFHAESIPKFVSHDREIAQHETNSNKFSPEKMLCTPLNLKSPTTMAQNVITSEVHFHARNKLHKIEKPYCLRYEPGPEVARTNIEIEKNSIAIHDIRGLEDTLSLDSCGITILALKSELSYEDFALEEQVRRVYISEVTGALKELFGASHIHVFDSLVSVLFASWYGHSLEQIRRRHQSFPLSTGEEYQFNQPTNLVHIGRYLDLNYKNLLLTIYAQMQHSFNLRMYPTKSMKLEGLARNIAEFSPSSAYLSFITYKNFALIFLEYLEAAKRSIE